MNRHIRKLALEYLTIANSLKSASLANDPSRNHRPMTFETAMELARSTLEVVREINSKPFVEG